MASLLINWLNDEVVLSRPVRAIEADFASGFLLAELLFKLGKLSSMDSVVDTERAEAMVHNFELIAEPLASLGVMLENQSVLDVLTETRGAASKVRERGRKREKRERERAADSRQSLPSPYFSATLQLLAASSWSSSTSSPQFPHFSPPLLHFSSTSPPLPSSLPSDACSSCLAGPCSLRLSCPKILMRRRFC